MVLISQAVQCYASSSVETITVWEIDRLQGVVNHTMLKEKIKVFILFTELIFGPDNNFDVKSNEFQGCKYAVER